MLLQASASNRATQAVRVGSGLGYAQPQLPYLIHRETEAQKGEVAYPRPHSRLTCARGKPRGNTPLAPSHRPHPPPRLTLPLGPVPTGDKSLRVSEPSLLTQAKSELSGICRDPCLVILGQGRPFVPPLWPLLSGSSWFPFLASHKHMTGTLLCRPGAFWALWGPLTAGLRAGTRWSRGFRLLRSKDGDPGALGSGKHGIGRAAGLCDARLPRYCDLRGGRVKRRN